MGILHVFCIIKIPVAEDIMLGGVGNMKGEKQMIYKNITFKAAPFSYDLTFDDRITLVGGVFFATPNGSIPKFV